MPFTVITLKSVPPSLRGDLTKWMQEIATGVYVGNFNTRIREKLWKRVSDAVGNGEATISFTSRNEIGYEFQTLHTERQVVDCDGIPLVMLPLKEMSEKSVDKNTGYSKAYKMRRARQYAPPNRSRRTERTCEDYIVIDIETTGLNEKSDQIIEIGAVRYVNHTCQYFQSLIAIDGAVPKSITDLTGISDKMLREEGRRLQDVLNDFLDFIQDYDLVGYNIGFDLGFLNAYLRKEDLPELKNRSYDLLKSVKKEQLFQRDYKLQTSLETYGILEKVPHRALEDAKLTYELSRKVNKFWS